MAGMADRTSPIHSGNVQVTTSQVDVNGCPNGNVDPGNSTTAGANYMVNYPTLGYCNANATYPGLPYCPTSQPSWSAYRCAALRPYIPTQHTASPARGTCTVSCVVHNLHCSITVPGLAMLKCNVNLVM